MATASAGGTFYPVGTALATLTTANLKKTHKITMTAVISAGSSENLSLLRENEAHFAILQGLYGYYAWNGKGPLEKLGPQKLLRSVTTLWDNVEQFTILSKHASTGTISDIENVKNLQIALGKTDSGTLGSNRVILGNLGLNIDSDFTLVPLGYGPSADALKSGRVVAMGTPGGIPTRAVTRVMAAMGDQITILRFTDKQVQQADGEMGLWTSYVIPSNTYPGQKTAIQTIAQPNFLAVRADVDENSVYQITKTIYENLPFLHSMHDATRAIALNRALTGLPVPLHPGALRYFREAGVEIPPDLKARLE